MNSIIIIHNDEKISSAEYNGLESLQKGVGGYIEVGGVRLFKLGGREVGVILYCDEEYLLKNDGKQVKINALASSLVNNPIYGNVVLIKEGMGEEEDPFDDKECDELINQLKAYRKENWAGELYKLHKRYDGVIKL